MPLTKDVIRRGSLMGMGSSLTISFEPKDKDGEKELRNAQWQHEVETHIGGGCCIA